MSLRSSPRPLPFLLEWDSAGRGALGPQAYVRYHPCLVNEGMGDAQPTRAHRMIGSPIAIAAIVASPLVLAAILLATRPWAPVLDMAMTELRVRDVGTRHTPLIGLPGRIGTFPEQGSHPGPLSFYLLAPFYRLTGARAWGLELGSVAINTAAVALLVWIGHRRAGLLGTIAFGAIAAVAVRGYGLNVLTHPWNPYFPVLLWLVVLAAAWSVLVGDHWMAVVAVVTASVAAQTHVSYLLNAIAMSVLVLAALGWRLRRPDERPTVLRPFLVTLGIGAVLWIPPFVDQLFRDPGNITMLVRHFASDPPEPAIGIGEGVRVFLRHLDAPSAFVDLVLHSNAFVHRSGLEHGTPILGALVLALWIAAAIAAHRMRNARLDALNLVISVALITGFVSTVRIFGKVWYYLTLWAWGTTLTMVLSITWTAWSLLRRRGAAEGEPVDDRAIVVLGAVTIAVCTAMSLGAAMMLDVPEPQLSDGLRAVVPSTEQALDDAIGPAVGGDGRYLVRWNDALLIGSQGYGLVNELERDGFHVGVPEPYHVPVTPQRVFDEGTYDAEIQFVSGKYIDEARARDGFVEVAHADVRSDAERARFGELRERVFTRLTEVGREDLLAKVDANLFGASLDPDLPRDIVDDMSEMLLIGEPVAVFLAPPGSGNDAG